MIKTILIEKVGGITKSTVTVGSKSPVAYSEGEITNVSLSSIEIKFSDREFEFKFDEFIDKFGQTDTFLLADYLVSNEYFIPKDGLTISSVTEEASESIKSKDHSEGGVHYLTDTNPAPTSQYFGFTPNSDDVVIASITYIDETLQTGDIKLITLVKGAYHTIPGLFSSITLESGNITLYKK